MFFKQKKDGEKDKNEKKDKRKSGGITLIKTASHRQNVGKL